MSKRAMLIIAMVVAISTGYDFYRGYHNTRSGKAIKKAAFVLG
jgi:predicted small secreted protein